MSNDTPTATVEHTHDEPRTGWHTTLVDRFPLVFSLTLGAILCGTAVAWTIVMTQPQTLALERTLLTVAGLIYTGLIVATLAVAGQTPRT